MQKGDLLFHCQDMHVEQHLPKRFVLEFFTVRTSKLICKAVGKQIKSGILPVLDAVRGKGFRIIGFPNGLFVALISFNSLS